MASTTRSASSSPLLYHLLKGGGSTSSSSRSRASIPCSAVSCCLVQQHHSSASPTTVAAITATTGVTDEMGLPLQEIHRDTPPTEPTTTIVKSRPPLPQPSRELAHVRYYIDRSVDQSVQGKVSCINSAQ